MASSWRSTRTPRGRSPTVPTPTAWDGSRRCCSGCSGCIEPPMDPEAAPARPAAEDAEPKESRGRWPVTLVFLLLATLTGLPFLAALLQPPAGRTFTGTFYYGDDFYNYLSYVQQAEDGAFLFRNKLVLEDHAPALVNLEWWAVGRLSRALGRRPLLAYRLLGLAATLALLLGIDRWLAAGGLPPSHRLA